MVFFSSRFTAMVGPRWNKVANTDDVFEAPKSLILSKKKTKLLYRFIFQLPSQQALYYFLILSFMFGILIQAMLFLWSRIGPLVLDLMSSLSPEIGFNLLMTLMTWLIMWLQGKQLRADIRADIRGTRAKDKSVEFTLVIVGDKITDSQRQTSESSFVIGHGFLALCPQQDLYSIVTSAHVVNDILDYKKEDEEQRDREQDGARAEGYGFALRIESICGTKRFEIDNSENGVFRKFEPDYYCHKGERDHGSLIVRLINGPSPTAFKNLSISQEEPHDTEFIGRSRDFMFRGEAFTLLPSRRVGLGIPSRPGCSGTPLFSPDGNLLALLHGEWKHRSSRHSNSNKNSEGLSDRVYVDMVKNFKDLRYWGDIYDDCLRAIEKLGEEDSREPNRLLRRPGEFITSFELAPEWLRPSLEKVKASPATQQTLPLFDPSKRAAELFETAKRVLPDDFKQTCPCFTRDDGYFTVHEVCEALVRHRRRNAHKDPRFRDYVVLVDEAQTTCKALSWPLVKDQNR